MDFGLDLDAPDNSRLDNKERYLTEYREQLLESQGSRLNTLMHLAGRDWLEEFFGWWRGQRCMDQTGLPGESVDLEGVDKEYKDLRGSSRGLGCGGRWNLGWS